MAIREKNVFSQFKILIFILCILGFHSGTHRTGGPQKIRCNNWEKRTNIPLPFRWLPGPLTHGQAFLHSSFTQINKCCLITTPAWRRRVCKGKFSSLPQKSIHPEKFGRTVECKDNSRVLLFPESNTSNGWRADEIKGRQKNTDKTKREQLSNCVWYSISQK